MTVETHPGPAARVRPRRHPHAAVHPAAPGHRASASGSASEGPESHYLKEGTPTMGGLLIVARRPRHLLLPAREPDASTFAPIAALASVGLPGRLRRLPQRPDRRGHPGPPEAHLADGRRLRRRLPDPADVRHHGHRRPVRRHGPDRPAWSTSCSPRSPSWPPRTASTSPTGSTGCPGARSRSPSSPTCSSRCSNTPQPGEPRVAVRADHRRAARLPLVQRPPGPDLHRRLGRALARGDAGRHGAHHRPDPGPARSSASSSSSRRSRSSSRSATSG